MMVRCPDVPHRYYKNYKVIHDLLLNVAETKIVKGFSTEQDVTFFADFKLEGPASCRHCTLTSRDLGDLFSRKYQNYHALTTNQFTSA